MSPLPSTRPTKTVSNPASIKFLLQHYSFLSNTAPLGVTNTMINFDRMPNSLTEVRLDISWTPPSNRNGPFETVFTYFGTQTPDYPPQRSNSSLNQTLILSEDQRTFAIPDGLPYAEYTVTLQPFNVKTGNRALPYSMTVRTIAIGKQRI